MLPVVLISNCALVSSDLSWCNRITLLRIDAYAATIIKHYLISVRRSASAPGPRHVLVHLRVEILHKALHDASLHLENFHEGK